MQLNLQTGGVFCRKHMNSNNFITSVNGTKLHKEAKVYLTEKLKQEYKGALFIDATTFIKNHPNVHIISGIVIGSYTAID